MGLRTQLRPVFVTENRRKPAQRAKWSAHIMDDAVRKVLQFRDRFTQLRGAFGDFLLEVAGVKLKSLLCAHKSFFGLLPLNGNRNGAGRNIDNLDLMLAGRPRLV